MVLIQVDPALLPRIRQAYQSDVHRFTGRQRHEHSLLEAALERLDAKEVNLWRAFTEHGTRATVYEQLARELADERERVTVALEANKRDNKHNVANLEAALAIITEIGERYARQPCERQRDILRHMVRRVVIDSEGRLVRLELKPPFTYLRALAHGEETRKRKGGSGTGGGKQKQTRLQEAGSFYISFGDPIGYAAVA